MNLYRTFKTFLYWAIPSSYRSEDISEFDTANDLVTIYKDLPDTGAYQNRKVSINELKDLVGVPKLEYYEFTFILSGSGATQPIESPSYISILTNTFPNSDFIISYNTANDSIKISDNNENDFFKTIEGSVLEKLDAFISGLVYSVDDNTISGYVAADYIDSNTIHLTNAVTLGIDYNFDYLCCTIKIVK